MARRLPAGSSAHLLGSSRTNCSPWESCGSRAAPQKAPAPLLEALYRASSRTFCKGAFALAQAVRTFSGICRQLPAACIPKQSTCSVSSVHRPYGAGTYLSVNPAHYAQASGLAPPQCGRWQIGIFSRGAGTELEQDTIQAARPHAACVPRLPREKMTPGDTTHGTHDP